MKKIIAFLLCVVMVFGTASVSVYAEGTEKHEKCPIIFIAGSSVDFVDGEGNPTSMGIEVLTDDDEGDGITKEAIIESTMNILLPFVMEGLPEDKWDTYGDALYEELAPIWDESRLDGNGNTQFGVGVAQSEIDYWDNVAQTVNHGKDGKFGLWDYKFRYDWRLSPYDHVDRLHQFIKDIIETTGCSQVALVGRCLGGNVITAYLDAYGSEGLVKKVVYDEVMSNGSSVINDCFSGQVELSDKHIQAYLLASEHYGKHDIGFDVSGVNELVLEIAERTYDLMAQVGVLDTTFGGIEDLYNRLYKEFMPAMLKATGLGTWASYWTSISDENFDTALELIFGKEGSEERAEYKGLVDKILYLRERIVKPRELRGEENLYKQFEKNYGVQFGVIAGYGLPIPPLGVNHNDNGDITVDTKNSSLGATVAGLFDTLDQDYIDSRIAEGYGEYISPDKKIDASTCIFPETTWFVKNKHHDIGTAWEELSVYFTQYTNVNAGSNQRNISRFLVVNTDDFRKYENLTEDNTEDAPWLEEIEQKPELETKIAALIRFITVLLKLFTQLINGTFSFEI